MSNAICVLDAHPMFRAALCGLLREGMPGHVIHEFADAQALIQHLEKQPAGLVIYDLLASRTLAMTSLSYISDRHRNCKVVALANTELKTGESFRQRIGISAVISKTDSEARILSVIQEVMTQSKPPVKSRRSSREPDAYCYWEALHEISKLSPRRFKILSMLAEGRLNKEIAWEVGASEATIKGVVTQFFKLLNLKTRTEIAVSIARFEKDSYLGLGAPIQVFPATALQACF